MLTMACNTQSRENVAGHWTQWTVSLDTVAYVIMQQIAHIHLNVSAASYKFKVTCTGLEAWVLLHYRQERCFIENA